MTRTRLEQKQPKHALRLAKANKVNKQQVIRMWGCGLSWLQGKHSYRIETQASYHKASKEQKIGRVRDRKQAKIAREYHLPAIR